MAERLAIGVLARAPSDQKGKTRLLEGLGGLGGADLRRAILLDTLAALDAVHRADRFVLFTPREAGAEIAELGANARLMPQRGEMLGQRLEHAFADLFALGYDAAALIGSDLPTLPTFVIEQGLDALGRGLDPVVLGPADDGGYYFIGLRRPHPELFRGVPWSTGSVLAATREVADRLALEVMLLPSWYDVDGVADLARALGASEGRSPRHLRAWADTYQHSSPVVSRLVRDRRPGV
jgi:rSAM/selenodomain-associated transferase 1